MKCPHCLQNFHEEQTRKEIAIGKDSEAAWLLECTTCPACDRYVLKLVRGNQLINQSFLDMRLESVLIRPLASQRPPPPPEVPDHIARDYREACLVFPHSASASAALSRRCLQHLLRETEKVKPCDLNSEIEEVLNRGKLPSHIVESLDAVRNIGNFAAHPIKSKSSGEVLPVEPGEAEWNLDTLEALFDFYFVQPAVTKRKRDALNAKLKDAGKPALK